MKYHIDTGIIYEKFGEKCNCPLCEIKKIVEEQLLGEFLNDAVMEDNTRILVGKKGFCVNHFDMLFSRQNKLSVALQVKTFSDKTLEKFIEPAGSAKNAKKLADKIENATNTCVICDYLEESMIKYYKTIARMFANEKDFYKVLFASKGLCMHHYAELLRYSSYAGGFAKQYLDTLSKVQKTAFASEGELLDAFCAKHDYRNALKPLGNAENALPTFRERLYGKKYD